MNSQDWRTLIVACIFIIFIFFLICLPVESQSGWGSYNTKYEYDSIRNQERIIRLLEDHNRSCK